MAKQEDKYELESVTVLRGSGKPRAYTLGEEVEHPNKVTEAYLTVTSITKRGSSYVVELEAPVGGFKAREVLSGCEVIAREVCPPEPEPEEPEDEKFDPELAGVMKTAR